MIVACFLATLIVTSSVVQDYLHALASRAFRVNINPVMENVHDVDYIIIGNRIPPLQTSILKDLIF